MSGGWGPAVQGEASLKCHGKRDAADGRFDPSPPLQQTNPSDKQMHLKPQGPEAGGTEAAPRVVGFHAGRLLLTQT